MSNAFGIGGWMYLFAPAPVATAARTAGNVKSTLGNAKIASSATSKSTKALWGLQTASDVGWFKRDLTNMGVLGRSNKKSPNTRQTKGIGKGIIPMTPEEQKNEKNKSKKSLMNRFTGFFGKKKH